MQPQAYPLSQRLTRQRHFITRPQLLLRFPRLSGGAVSTEAIPRCTPDGVVLKMKTQTVLGDFAVDDRGSQLAHNALTIQWQDGQSAAVCQGATADGEAFDAARQALLPTLVPRHARARDQVQAPEGRTCTRHG